MKEFEWKLLGFLQFSVFVLLLGSELSRFIMLAIFHSQCERIKHFLHANLLVTVPVVITVIQYPCISLLC